MGLFDRSVSTALFETLLAPPAIPGLTEALLKLTHPQRTLRLKRLEDARLLTVIREAQPRG